MPKQSRPALALLWLTLAAMPAVATETAGPSDDDAAAVTVSSTAVPLVTSVSNPAFGAARQSPIEPGRHGGAELAGALLLCGLLLRAAYRRGII